MREDDLAPFAIADGLLARIAESPGRMSEREIDYLVEQARMVLAKSTGETLHDAGRAMEKALDEGGLTIQCGGQFAVVTIYGRLLVVSSPGSSWPAPATLSATSLLGDASPCVVSSSCLPSRWECERRCLTCSTSCANAETRPGPPKTPC